MPPSSLCRDLLAFWILKGFYSLRDRQQHNVVIYFWPVMYSFVTACIFITAFAMQLAFISHGWFLSLLLVMVMKCHSFAYYSSTIFTRFVQWPWVLFGTCRLAVMSLTIKLLKGQFFLEIQPFLSSLPQSGAWCENLWTCKEHSWHFVQNRQELVGFISIQHTFQGVVTKKLKMRFTDVVLQNVSVTVKIWRSVGWFFHVLQQNSFSS